MTACPKCGSNDLMEFPAGGYRCNECAWMWGDGYGQVQNNKTDGGEIMEKVPMEKDGEFKEVTQGAVEDFEAVGWERVDASGGEGQDTPSSSPPPKSDGPRESFKIPVSEQRNLKVAIWDGEYGLSIALEEGKKDEETGEWSNNRIYLPVAKSFEIAQRIADAGKFVRDSD